MKGNVPGVIHYIDDDVVVINNQLKWVPVMLLVMPKEHMSQEDMWRGDILAKVSKVALEMGDKFCPGGFRLLSNFGYDAIQSQSHGHLHVLGGTRLGHYV
jgi:histidine triad (HIT) family protein